MHFYEFHSNITHHLKLNIISNYIIYAKKRKNRRNNQETPENKNVDIEFSAHDACIRHKTTQKAKIVLFYNIIHREVMFFFTSLFLET